MLNNISKLKLYGLKRLIISFTPTKENIHQFSSLPKFAYDNEVDSIHITRLMPVGRGRLLKDILTMDSSLYMDNFKLFIENYSKVLEIVNIDNELAVDKRSMISLTFAGDQSNIVAFKSKRQTCGFGLGAMSINYDGNIYPCASLHFESFSFGSIEDSLEDVIAKAKQFMCENAVDNIAGCKDCNYRYMCGGGCRACAYFHSGCKDIHAQDPLCEKYKNEIPELAWTLNMPYIGTERAIEEV
jgi:radical SAM protein with 4Fe4S-binding SPASM domain